MTGAIERVMESSDTGIHDSGNTEHTSASEIRKESSQENSNSYSRTKGRNERKYSCMLCIADYHTTL